MKIVTAAPIFYTSDCGNSYLNADGKPTFGPDLPQGFGVLKPGETAQSQKGGSKKKAKNAAKKVGSLVGSGKVKNAVGDTAQIVDSLKNVFSGGGRGSVGQTQKGPNLPNDAAMNSDNQPGRPMSTGTKVIIGTVAVLIVVGIIYAVSRKGKK